MLSWPRFVAMLVLALLVTATGAYAPALLRQHERAQLQTIDIPFLQSMRVHHDQAISMAASVLDSSDPLARQIAHEIYNTQLQETGYMRGLLAAWQALPMPSGELWDWMLVNADAQTAEFVSRCRSGGKMPGMATQEELNTLYSSTGKDKVLLFATMMTDHHLAAIEMLRHAAQHAHSPDVRSLAAGMMAAQRKELLQLSRLAIQTGS